MKQDTSLLSKKNILYLGLGILSAYFILNLVVYVAVHKPKSKPVEKMQSSEMTKRQSAIANAEEYLQNSISSIETSQRLILDYLQRKFDLDPKLGAAGTPILIPQNTQTYPLEIHFLERIANPDKFVSVQPRSSLEGISYTNVYAANCDHTPLPSDYWSVVRNSLNAGGYNLTHIALALAFIQDNGCNKPPDIGDIDEKLISGMVAIAKDNTRNMDLRFEATAFLMLSGRYDQVESNWIDTIVATQDKDGSWADKLGQATTDHTTVLALWALLEYEHANKPYEPLIRRPSAAN